MAVGSLRFHGISFPQEMRFKKDFFPDKPLERRKSQARQILSQNNSVKTQGMKNEILHFGTFSVRDEAFQNIFRLKFFFLEEKYIFNLSPELEKFQNEISFFIP